MRNYYMWFEIQANKNRIIDDRLFKETIKRCKACGFEGIILGVKDTSGFGIYNSSIVPHYSKLEEEFKTKDYLKEYIQIVHDFGLKIYAAVDVFSEGRIDEYSNLSPGFKNKNWQTEIYGLNNLGKNKIVPVSEAHKVNAVSAIDDFNDIFVNPVRDDVQEYELEVINELIEDYDLDGFCLDRVRFIGLGADFSNYSRVKFENYLGFKIGNWPEDIYYLKNSSSLKNKDLDIKYGPLFGKWLTFRASVINSFITSVRDTVNKVAKKIEFLDYAGSWYPIYYQLGANWASYNYQVDEYPCVKEDYSNTGYVEKLDSLVSGFYYPDITIKEAEHNNKPAYWYSVEGAGKMVNMVTKNAIPIIGSLFVAQYKKKPKKLQEAIKMCFEVSDGCMVFDLSYIENYNWWNYCKMEKNGDLIEKI